MITASHIFDELYDIFWKAPLYTLCLEVSLLISVVWLVLHRKKDRIKLTPEQKADLLDKWNPEPLINDVASTLVPSPKVVSGRAGKRLTLDGHDCLNLATHNYLGLVEDKEIEESAIKCLRKYGVGSCGPRGFYGTSDVHLELEVRLAKFMQVEAAVLYSYGFSTIASAIPAYCKRGDIIFVDECVHFAIQKGLDASRSKIVYFKHNDMDDLDRLLAEQQKADLKNPKKAAKSRRFLVAEGIYMNVGDICPLQRLVELRQQYKLRLILDESVSFGVLGENGRGLTEHLNIDRQEIDIICGTLEGGVGSIGGFCVGTTYIIDHQVLSGLGYCFSASTPPLLTQAAISAIDRFEREPSIFEELRTNSKLLHEKLNRLTHFELGGHPLSPVKHLYLKTQSDRDTERSLIGQIVDACVESNLAVTNAEYLVDREQPKCPRSSIRLTSNRLLTGDDIEYVVNTLENVSKRILV